MLDLTTLYLDTEVKKDVVEKLNRLNGEQSKGQLAALIRVLLKQFVMTPDEKINPLLAQAVLAEYTYSKNKSKRSNL